MTNFKEVAYMNIYSYCCNGTTLPIVLAGTEAAIGEFAVSSAGYHHAEVSFL
jgi:hypothetical protein